MSEETIVIEVEQESIKPDLIELNEESPDDICNSEHSNCVVKETIDLAKDEHDDQKHGKKSLVWDVKMVDGDEADARHVRRNSASLFGENRKLVVRSRYRGGSFGSCHDMCKHGHGHTPEVKPKIYLNKTPLSFSASQAKGSVENRKKSVVVRRLSFPKEKPATDQRVKTVNKKQEEKSLGVDDKSSLVSSNGGFKDEEKPLGMDDKRSLVSSDGGSKDKEKSLGEDDKISLVSSDSGFKLLRSKPNVKKAASMNTRVNNHLKNGIHTHHQQELKGKLPEDLPEKTLYMIEPNGKCAPPETSRKAPPIQRNRLPKTEGKSSYIGTRKGSKPTQTEMSKSLFPSSSKSFKIKTEKLEDSELVIKRSEKYKSSTQQATSYTPKLKLIAPKAKQNGKDNSHLIKPLLSAVDKPSKSEEEKLVNRKTKPITAKAKVITSTLRPKPGAPKVKQDVEPKAKTSMIRAKSQNAEGQSVSSVWKMKFRRGKVVSLPSGNNTPVKLKFRRPRVLSDSCHAQSSGNSNYKNSEGVGNDAKKDHGEEASKVVLRRHEATSKKDDVDLNNVIEETASKLVKTRKSKVKALVGAFETVMSLRDHKSATDAS